MRRIFVCFDLPKKCNDFFDTNNFFTNNEIFKELNYEYVETDEFISIRKFLDSEIINELFVQLIDKEAEGNGLYDLMNTMKIPDMFQEFSNAYITECLEKKLTDDEAFSLLSDELMVKISHCD